ncbi:alanyl-tRNA editing protein [Halocatena salina]|uniref:Alanine--tRNA ligase n=1 Tax=Halocatena salina TaxID=2934340 RepID=A0A8U0A7B1_9EURY|nr:DHHA1 domain-containing protein [Halocatena salina]UPM44894.1 DHHA1 domain-containing protein [Halocatena salina]
MLAELGENLAAAEPYVTDFKATVEAIDGHEVRLDQTYFYAEGGGQPADRGTLAGIDVVDVQTRDGKTVHTLDTSPTFEIGDTVDGNVSDDFRTYCMRAHTASHLVYGVGRTLFDDHGYGGFDIGEKKVRLDFKTSRDSTDVNELTFERMINEVVWESKDVTWEEMNTEAACNRSDIVFNLSDDAAEAETVRIVEIIGWDIAACGGTHVRNTREIGPVKVVDVSNPGSGLVRVEFAVGPHAIDAQIDETRNANRTADVLDTSVDNLPKRARSLLEEKTSLEDELAELSERLLETQLDTLQDDVVSKDGNRWLVGEVDAVGANAVSERIDDLVGDTADIVVLTGSDGSTFVVVGTTGELDANEIIQDVTDEFGGGGGGRPSLAQGGGLSADPKTVVEYLSDTA